MRRILITNDDGIEAAGIIRLAKAALKLGEVWVVAPSDQRSAVSHAITLRETIEVKPHDFPVEGVKAYSCSGTPADCVRVGILAVMPKKPDVVLSGINNGYNVASDIQYSGTAAAAFEAAFQKCRGIALSEQVNACHDITDRYLEEVLAEYIDKDLGLDRNSIVNINFPGGKVSEYKGIKVGPKVAGDSFFRDGYDKLEEKEDGTIVYKVNGVYNEDAETDTDFRAVVDKYISVGIVKNIM